MGVIIFNKKSSKDLGIEVEHYPSYEFPEKDIEFVHVPGRDGDIAIDKGTYRNVNRSYDIAIIVEEGREYPESISDILSWLHSGSGYQRLEDSYDESVFYLAAYSESGSFDNIENQAGRTTINFNCKPQRFLKSGETEVFCTSGHSILNPTQYRAMPNITVKGTGTCTVIIGGYPVNISEIGGAICVNSQIKNSYYGNTNKNNVVTLTDGYPELISGNNIVTWDGTGVTSVSIVPNWWKL